GYRNRCPAQADCSLHACRFVRLSTGSDVTANLFADAAPPPEGERFDVLLTHRNLVVERIVSSARIDPQEYVQVEDEWVVLLRGEAVLEVGGEVVRLGVGDHCFLPAG